MKKILVVASLLGTMMLASPQFVTPVRAAVLGEICWHLQPAPISIFGDFSVMRIAITESGTTWLLSGRLNHFQGGDLIPGFWAESVPLSGAMARAFVGNALELSLIGQDYEDSTGPFSDFRFHARIDANTGNGTWKRMDRNGGLTGGTLTVVSLSSCQLPW